MAYEFRGLKRQKVRYNSANDDNPLTYQLYVDGEKIIPASATIALYKSGSTTAVLAATAMTVTGSLLTYSVDTTTVATFPAETNYRADIIVTDASAVTYEGHLIFDVVKYLLRLNIGRDQLLDRDANIMGAEWGGDDDLSGLIESCRDELQIMLETKAIDDEQLMENMVVDASRISTVARLYILEAYYRNKDADLADSYEEKFNRLWRAFLNGIKYDKNLDGHEDSKQGGIVKQRLYT